MNEAILNAIEIAAIAHEGQRDGAGIPYIQHPLAVLRSVAAVLPEDTNAQVAAVLHDVLEDTGWREYNLLKNGVNPRAVELVKAVTRVKGETYDQFIDRVATSGSAAIVIKLCDLQHNLSRMDGLPLSRKQELEPKYLAAQDTLTNALKNLCATA
jgi:(p)ppGpp synthase/HD superfamily hydrolase